jgi:hypothetical protein
MQRPAAFKSGLAEALETAYGEMTKRIEATGTLGDADRDVLVRWLRERATALMRPG